MQRATTALRLLPGSLSATRGLLRPTAAVGARLTALSTRPYTTVDDSTDAEKNVSKHPILGVDRSKRPKLFFAMWGFPDMDDAVASEAFHHYTSTMAGENSTKLAMLGEHAAKLLVTTEFMSRFPEYSAPAMETLTSAVLSKSKLQELGFRDYIIPAINTPRAIFRHPKNHHIINETIMAIFGAVYKTKGAVAMRDLLMRKVLQGIESEADADQLVRKSRPLYILSRLAGEGSLVAKVIATGENNNCTVGIYKGNTLLGQGQAQSRMRARDRAALDVLQNKYSAEFAQYPVDYAAVAPSVEQWAIPFEKKAGENTEEEH